jgi:adenosylcobinamide kinase/adenosylcobinamide-phosphate guanylyltransferase
VKKGCNPQGLNPEDFFIPVKPKNAVTQEKGMVRLILGGAKSGKSAYALRLAEAIEGRRAFIATAQPTDDEMADKIKLHKAERADRWDTFEEPLNIAPLIRELATSYSVILIDCLTLWTSNLLLAGHDFAKEQEALLSSLTGVEASVFVVSNEVGLGIVPENRLARQFRNYAGDLNRAVAEVANDVYFITAGIPIKIKEAVR